MKTVVSFCLILFTAMAFGQNGSIKGTVVDIGLNDEPVLFANVQVKGLEITAETNFHGNFELENLKPGKYTLVVSYLGYETIEIPAIVVENAITKVNGGLSVLSFSMGDLDVADELTESEDTNEVPLRGEQPKK